MTSHKDEPGSHTLTPAFSNISNSAPALFRKPPNQPIYPAPFKIQAPNPAQQSPEAITISISCPQKEKIPILLTQTTPKMNPAPFRLKTKSPAAPLLPPRKLRDHLGNVTAVVSDGKLPVGYALSPRDVDYFVAEVVSARDFYPFGMGMPGRGVEGGGIGMGSRARNSTRNGTWAEQCTTMASGCMMHVWEGS